MILRVIIAVLLLLSFPLPLRAAPAATPPPPGPVEVLIDTDKRTLTIISNGQPYKTYPIAVGTSETPSPLGEWKVVHRSRDWGGGFGTRWLGLNVPWGIYGIHGTNKPYSIGRAASHGCFRMHNEHVEEIFPWIPLGTKVRVIGSGPGLRLPKRDLKPGSSGQDVVAVQYRLQNLGLYWGYADGRYGPAMEMAVRYFQTLCNLPADGVVNDRTRHALGF